MPRESWADTRTNHLWSDFFEAGPVAVSSLYLSLPPQAPFLRILGVPPELRTGHGERMIYSELAIEWMGMLLASDLLYPMVLPSLLNIGAHMRAIVDEMRELYLDRGNLPTLFTEDLLNRVFETSCRMDQAGEAQPITFPVIRLHVNLTTANKIDDSKGLVGTSLLTSTREWLRENFGSQNTYMDPVRTAFLVILEGIGLDAAFERLRRFGPEVSGKMREDQSLRETAVPEKIQRFVPQHVALGLNFTVDDVPNIRGGGLHREGITRAQSRVLEAIEEFRKEIAASTVYLDEHQGTLDITGPSLPLYTRTHLPPESDPVYRKYLETLAGFMGDGVFGVTNGSPDGLAMKEHPRHRHNFGQLSHVPDMGGGGVLEGFDAWVAAFEGFLQGKRVNLEDYDPLLQFYLRDGEATSAGLRLLLKLGEDATRMPNYPRLVKPLETWTNLDGGVENANFFAEKTAAAGYRQFIVFEYDSYKDFRRLHAPTDEVDSEFQFIRKLWFDEAERMGLPEPVMTPYQGDLVLLGIDAGDLLGAYIEGVRDAVRAAYADRPFQRSTKFTYERYEPILGRMAPHTVRLPIWVKNGEYSVGAEWPGSGYEPYQGTLTVSGTYFETPRPIRRLEEGKALFQAAENAGKFIDETVKYLGGERRLSDQTRIALDKNGWAPLPAGLRPDVLK